MSLWLLAAVALQIQPAEPLFADGSRTFALTVTVSTDGVCGGPPVEVTASSGEVEELTQLSRGVFLARWRPDEAGSVVFGASSGDVESEQSFTVSERRRLIVEPVRAAASLAGTHSIPLVVKLTGDGPVPATPTVTSSAGRIRNVTAAGAGRWTAELVPPSDRRPQVSLVAASLDDVSVSSGFAAVRWTARLALPIDTEPGSRITARVGTRESAPVTANEQGRAVVEIDIAPGDRELQLEGVDVLGNPTRSSVPVDVPAFRRRHVISRAGRPTSDGRVWVEVERFEVSSTGQPRPVRAAWARVAATGGAQSVRVDLGGRSVEQTVTVGTPPIVDLEVVVSPPVLTIGDPQGSRVEVRAITAEGEPAATEIQVTAEGADLELDDAASDTRTGRLRAQSRRIDPEQPIRLVAEMDGVLPCVMRREVVIAQQPGTPSAVRFHDPSAQRLLGSGRSELAFEVTDEGGNPVTGAEVSVEGGSLRVGDVQEREPGLYALQVVAPDVRREVQTTLRVRAGAADAAAAIRVVPRPSQTVVSVRATGGWNGGALTSVGTEVEAAQSVPGISRLTVVARGGAAVARIRDAGLTARMTLGQAALGARWQLLDLDSRWEWGVSAGPEVRFARAQLDVTGVRVPATGARFGAGVSTDGAWRMGRHAVTARLGLSWTSPAREGVRGNLGGLTLGLGYRHGF